MACASEPLQFAVVAAVMAINVGIVVCLAWLFFSSLAPKLYGHLGLLAKKVMVNLLL